MPTFNVSTTAAFVAAGAGLPRRQARQPLRHQPVRLGRPARGARRAHRPRRRRRSRGASTRSASASCSRPRTTRRCGTSCPVRKALGVRTIFNFLGPLTNPAGATRQLIGVVRPGLHGADRRRAGAARLRATRWWSPATDGMDEVSVVRARRGCVEVTPATASRSLHGLARATSASSARSHDERARAARPRSNAEIARAVLERRAGPAPRAGRAQRRRRAVGGRPGGEPRGGCTARRADHRLGRGAARRWRASCPRPASWPRRRSVSALD